MTDLKQAFKDLIDKMSDDKDEIQRVIKSSVIPLTGELRISILVDEAAANEHGVSASCHIVSKIIMDKVGDITDLELSPKDYLELGPVAGILMAIREGLHKGRGTSFDSAVEDARDRTASAEQIIALIGAMDQLSELQLAAVEPGGNA